MNAVVTLSKGGSSVSLPAPARIAGAAASAGQAMGRTAGGEVYAYDLGTPRREAELEFRSLTSAEKEALAGFFEDDASGMQETWTYTHADGTVYTARFVQDSLTFVQFAHNVWDVTVRLELSALID